MANGNPFKPSFGASPPVLAGRTGVLDALGEALDSGTGHPDFTSLLVGVRGAGKTATLNAVQEYARNRGWLVIAETAHGDLCNRLAAAVLELSGGGHDRGGRPRLAGISALGVGVEFTRASPVGVGATEVRLRSVLTDLGSLLTSERIGLLITLDELQGGEPPELREFATTLQHVTRRESLPIAFVGAGLPSIDDTVLRDSAITFLQRCSRHEIAELSDAATATAFAEPIAAHGGRISDDALRRAVETSNGYPFMVQLIGFHSWRAASSDPPNLQIADVSSGIAEAERRLPHLVLAPMWRSMSGVDRRFALAMAQDDGETSTADLSKRLGRSSSYISTYRSRLIRAGFIRSTGHGRVEFAHQATRAWLRSPDRTP
ncbi:MAG: AAA family ATPase [Acidimicrobiaceae bacterium]|nr:AAA family ATPase [Acidimicrobiaceae bacterium]MYE75888.1 AAA family ATPase [Acidimicrobiaceae bacterium]MYJ42576.1 AAA family ATPase [Acidimicrobiaceae bacterium]